MAIAYAHTCVDRPHLPCAACNHSQQAEDYKIAREDLIRQAKEKIINIAFAGTPDELLKVLHWFADQLEAL
jgi:hypothetical protein